jgi:Plasma membrane calcium transporter ATPase C terminal
LFLSCRWGRGNPEEYTEAINLGGDDSRYDPMDDKKPRTGQILWIRGLTRLQTQVSNFENDKVEPPFFLHVLIIFKV